MNRSHLPDREPCPLLPQVESLVTAEAMAPFRGRYDAEFYLAALRYGQSLWMEGKAAQSLLQLNKAMMGFKDLFLIELVLDTKLLAADRLCKRHRQLAPPGLAFGRGEPELPQQRSNGSVQRLVDRR